METTGRSRPSAADRHSALSQFKMIDVSGKKATRRRAIAQGKITLASSAYVALKNGTNPKGNVLAMAEVAGIMAAKKTSDLLPLCHPLPLQSVSFRFEFLDYQNALVARCEAITDAQTGVEMEALCGVQSALLAIYDLSKAVDPEITISEVRLELKEGGKSGVWRHPKSELRAPEPKCAPDSLASASVAVLTVSDRTFSGEAIDRSGPLICGILRDWGATVIEHCVVPDEKAEIQSAVKRMAIEARASLVITTGGTGLGPRDVTPEAIEEISDRPIPGIGECLRRSGSLHTETAWLSRSMGALIGRSWVISLPGGQNAVAEGLEALRPLLAHGLHIAAGGGHP